MLHVLFPFLRQHVFIDVYVRMDLVEAQICSETQMTGRQ